MAKTLVIYHYCEASTTHIENFRHFLAHGYERGIDYLIVISGGCTVDLPLIENIAYEFVPNVDFDYGGIRRALRGVVQRGLTRYKYFVVVNATVRGPYVPSYFTGSWTEAFLDLLVGDVRLAGSTICIPTPGSGSSRHFKARYGGAEPYPHVQSMTYALDRATLELLLGDGFFSRDLGNTKASVIVHYEILLSQLILRKGGNISCLLPEYQGLDYRLPQVDPNPTSRHGDPSFVGGYYGRSPHPLETVFVKTNRGVADPKLLAQLGAARSKLRPDCSAYTSSMIEATLGSIQSAWRGHRNFAIWLTRRLRAAAVADLGVDYGFSTFCFALAGAGHVYGVDSFQGDEHAGARDTQAVVMQTARRLGLKNITLVQGYFENVAKGWQTPLDILHIDGLHTYEAVRSDYLNWIGFVREQGVVLFHDTCVPHFGVRALFDEISLPKTNFRHSHGLGVVSRDPAIIREIAETFSMLIEPETTQV